MSFAGRMIRTSRKMAFDHIRIVRAEKQSHAKCHPVQPSKGDKPESGSPKRAAEGEIAALRSN
jgi:hypothetical protein